MQSDASKMPLEAVRVEMERVGECDDYLEESFEHK